MPTQFTVCLLYISMFTSGIVSVNIMLSQVFIVLGFAAFATAQYGGYDGEFEHYNHHPEYKFDYSVHDPHTHDIKSQHESRHGDLVKGFYTLKEADGTLREVHYTADPKSGFNAEVHRSGHAHHPSHYHSSAGAFYAQGYGQAGFGGGDAYSTQNNNLYNQYY